MRLRTQQGRRCEIRSEGWGAGRNPCEIFGLKLPLAPGLSTRHRRAGVCRSGVIEVHFMLAAYSDLQGLACHQRNRQAAGRPADGAAACGLVPHFGWQFQAKTRTGAFRPDPPTFRAYSIASNSSMKPAIICKPLSQKAGSLASRPNGANNSLWCLDPPAASMSKYFSSNPSGASR